MSAIAHRNALSPTHLSLSTFRSFDMVRPFDKLRDRRLTNRAHDTAGSGHRTLGDQGEGLLLLLFELPLLPGERRTPGTKLRG